MGKINHTPHTITVEMSIDELLAACVTMGVGECSGAGFAGQVAARKVIATWLAPELAKMKRYKIERLGEKIIVTMDDVDLKT
jgi:hypothetical protein